MRDDDRVAAPSFFCPLTMAVMKDPVQDREGNSYEKEAILQWLAKNSTSPITRNRLSRKHLVPNRALKEAIDFEGHTYAKETRQTPVGEMKVNAHSSNHHRRDTWSCWAPTAIPTSSSSGGVASARFAPNPPHHYRVINNFLSSLNGKYRLDCFGTAFLPMSFEDEGPKMLLVIESPPGKETFRLYTHFNGSIERCRDRSASTENRVLGNLLRHGRHKSLTLAGVCDERVRFSFEEKNSEISSEAKVMNVLDMFVKVSYLMKKIVESNPPRSHVTSSSLTLPPPPASTVSASDSSTAAVAGLFEVHSKCSLNPSRFELGCRSVSESGRLQPSTDRVASSSAAFSSVEVQTGHSSCPHQTKDLSSCCAFYLK
ncbi:hypothetical protein ACHAXA_006561 [Cyclostephanos tholiformis]|uniref:U-box domain-containing protein n=1 Tax=Cyclostephanos tholiformis TaxID=382380 RepID=A0ABD3RS28_9STRA